MSDINKKYVTINEGVDFRTIAKIMSEKGYQMNHATARNVLIMAIENMLSYVSQNLGTKLSKDQIKQLAQSQEIHDAMIDIIYLAHKELQKEQKGKGSVNGNKSESN